MCFNIVICRLFTFHVARRNDSILLYESAPEALEAKDISLYAIMQHAEHSLVGYVELDTDHDLTPEDVDISIYLSYKLVESVGDLLQFDRATWMTAIVMAGFLSIFTYYLEALGSFV